MIASKTLAAVYKFIEDKQAKDEMPHRAHLGASVIGKECGRKLWYDFHWTKAEKFAGRMLALFNRGHLEEERFIAYLQGIGCEVWAFNPNAPLKRGKPQQWRITDHDGHFGGSPDAVARGLPELKEEPFVCEFKTHGDKSFTKLKEDGLLKAKWEHYVQMQVSMFKLSLKFGLYCAVNKNTDELYFEIVQLNETIAKQAVQRAGQIIWSNEPLVRIGTSPAHYGCKYCHLNRLCYFGDVVPDRNCRTCKHSLPIKDENNLGRWRCLLHGNALSEDAQRTGCSSYQVNPEFHRPT